MQGGSGKEPANPCTGWIQRVVEVDWSRRSVKWPVVPCFVNFNHTDPTLSLSLSFSRVSLLLNGYPIHSVGLRYSCTGNPAKPQDKVATPIEKGRSLYLSVPSPIPLRFVDKRNSPLSFSLSIYSNICLFHRFVYQLRGERSFSPLERRRRRSATVGETLSTIEITRLRRNVIEADAALPAAIPADGTGNVVQRGREHLEIGRERSDRR